MASPVFMLDYKEEIKRLISENYQPSDSLNKEFEYSTEKLTESLKNILPFNAVDEHLVYEALLELGFDPKEDSKKPLQFSWYFERKKG